MTSTPSNVKSEIAASVTDQPPRNFVPKDFDPRELSQVLPLYDALQNRPIHSAPELERWLADASELTAIVNEYGTRRYIEKSCHTDDAQKEAAYLHFVEAIEPEIKPRFFELQKKYLESPYRNQLDPRQYRILDRNWQAEVELFREKNVALQTLNTKLVTEYDKLSGAMTVNFRGTECTMQEAARFLEEPDRATRQEVWTLSAERRLRDREAIEGIFDQLLELRQQMAVNADLPDYRAYIWKEMKRFDYTPGDCLRFAEAVEAHCMPVVHDLNRRRCADLGLPRLRPWDLSVDARGRAPLRPFTDGDTDELVRKTREIFSRLSPALADDFDSLRKRGNLDLASRKGKQPGGYQMTLDESRQPFIFMNAAGMQDDVETLLHEGGHAFHCLAASRLPLIFLHSPTMEFCEVASMSMELLAADHFDVFYAPPEAARAKRALLEGVARVLPWIATIDSFQHWLYTHPGHTHARRTEAWLNLCNLFGSDIDWTGHEEVRLASWQRQLHLFGNPFYYIEYGIAQLGALQLWLRARQDMRTALSNYRAALALGGTRALPELFAAAGLTFDFSAKTVKPLMDALSEELRALPS